jgi:enoyl-CoA hydratase/carnithine racemase
VLDLVHHDAVAEIRMDRPPANALNRELLEAVDAAMVRVQGEGALAIVLTGRPGMFSGGLDVPAMLGLDRAGVEGVWQSFFNLTRRLAASPVPVIAALSGHAPAGGAVLALHCDYRIAAAGKFRMGLNEVQVGLPVPSTILLALEMVVGARMAQRLATRGELLAMADAQAAGLVDELVEPEGLLAAAVARAGELLALPPVAMNTTRLAAKSRLLEAQAVSMDVTAATNWWFSAETQAEMGKLAARLSRPGPGA